jgi:hypothetical protein
MIKFVVKTGRGGRRNRKLRREGRKAAKWRFVTLAQDKRRGAL